MNNKKKLVLCGGGMKGIALVGALHALETKKYLDKFTIFCGTSIGSLINALYVIGYAPNELHDFIKLFEFNKLKSVNLNNLRKFALYDEKNIEYVLKKLITWKSLSESITLKELYESKKKKLIFTATCLHDKKLCYISYETEPDMPLFTAMRIAISLPFIIPPVLYKNKYYVDGACFDNYPFSVFNNQLDDALGILLIDTYNTVDQIVDLETYIFTVFDCIKIGMTKNCKKGFEKNSIEINVESIGIIDFDIDNKKKDELFMNGYKTVLNYIDSIEQSNSVEKSNE